MKPNKSFNIGLFLVVFCKLVHCQLLIPNKGISNNDDMKWLQPFESNKVQILLSKVVAQLATLSSIVFHYENDTGEIVDITVKRAIKIMTVLKETTEKLFKKQAFTLLAINYSKFNQSSKVGKLKDNNRKSAHLIVLSDPLQFELLSEGMTREDDVIVYLYHKKYIKPEIYSFLNNENDSLNTEFFFKGNIIRNVHSIFVLEIDDELLQLHDICYYCGENSNQVVLKAQQSLSSSFKEDDDVVSKTIKEIIVNRFNNFNNHVFRIAFAFLNVTLTCEVTEDTEYEDETHTYCKNIEGIEGRLLRELQRKLNFKYQLVNPHHPDKEAWNNMIIDVNMSKVDWAMGGITMSESRFKKVEFSESFGDDPMRILFADREGVFAEGLKVIFAFGISVWLVLGLTIIILSTTLYNWNQYFNTEKSLNFSQCVWIISSILIEQSITNTNVIGGKRMIIMWFLCCVIISNSYKGKLYALLATPRPRPVHLEDLVNEGYEAILHEDDSSLMETMLKTSSDPTLVKLSKKTRTDFGYCGGVKALLKRKMIIIEEQNVIVYSFNKECAPQLTYEEVSKYRLTTDVLLPSSHGWPFRKKTPYLKSINKYIVQLHSTGLYEKWREISMRSAGNDAFSTEGKSYIDSDKVFKLKSFFGLVILWFIGIFVSLLTFAAELILFRFYHKKKYVNDENNEQSIGYTFVN